MIKPELCKEIDPSDIGRYKEWFAEPKLDGVRCIAYIDKKDETVRLISRSGRDISDSFPELAFMHKEVKFSCTLDGELFCESFPMTATRVQTTTPLRVSALSVMHPTTYHAWDLLHCGQDLTRNPVTLYHRKRALERIAEPGKCLTLVPWAQGDPQGLFDRITGGGGEGIILKDPNSFYQEGKRSPKWLKVKAFKEENFLVIGVTPGTGTRADTFGALILAQGLPNNGAMKWMGNVGTGFTRQQCVQVLRTLIPFKAEIMPYHAEQLGVKGPVMFWIKKVPVYCSVRYQEIGSDGHLRFPSFRGLSIFPRQHFYF